MSTTASKTSSSTAAAPAKKARKPAAKTKPPKPADTTAKTPSAPPPTQAAAPAVVAKAQSVVLGPLMRKKELIDRVVARSGIKKKDAKPVIEATLAELGEALAEKRELALQPMGKIKIKRERILPNGRMLVARIRQPDTAATAGDTPPEKAIDKAFDPDATE